MQYNRFHSYLFIFVFLTLLISCDDSSVIEVRSPDNSISLEVWEENGFLFYQISKDEQPVLLKSNLGLKRRDSDFSKQLKISSIGEITTYTDSYRMYQGKQRNIVYLANQLIIGAKNADENNINLQFRVSDDGVVFRYLFPEQDKEVRFIEEEITSFQFDSSTVSWIQPMSVAKTGWEHSNPSYEEPYLHEVSVGTVSPLGEGFVYPALFKTGNDYVLITESGLERSHAGTRLLPFKNGYKVGMPQEKEVFTDGRLLPHNSLPWHTQWRVIAVGGLTDIVESTLGTDVAQPAIELDTSLIQPGYASWSWALLKDNSVNYDTTRLYIDYAASMNWQYCLIDVNWDTRIGEKGIRELVSYAASKDVGLLLWYNSAGEWNTTPYHPKSKLLTHEDRRKEFAWLKEMGIRGVKVDFFGGDGQSMIAYYHDILKDAAEAGLLVNFHGATLPRGWHRTYPNLMTMESVRGFEFITFFQETADDAPRHCALIPFTRNVFDPMDFTPMAFSEIPNIQKRTFDGFELALATLFQSGIQHFAETPFGIKDVPEFVNEYLQNLPAVWDETRLIDGYPGKYVILGRRSGNQWFVSGINAKEENLQLDVKKISIIGDVKGKAIKDGENGGLIEFDFKSGEFQKDIIIKSNGGFVMKLNALE